MTAPLPIDEADRKAIVAAVAENAFAGHRAQGVLTYLANALVPLDSEGREDPAGGIPYSTVVGVDSQADFLRALHRWALSRHVFSAGVNPCVRSLTHCGC